VVARARPPLVAFAVGDGVDGVDSLCFDEEAGVYLMHVGGGLPAAERARGEREISVPVEIVERVAFLAACMLEHQGLL
jgi:hypothetical protein